MHLPGIWGTVTDALCSVPLRKEGLFSADEHFSLLFISSQSNIGTTRAALNVPWLVSFRSHVSTLWQSRGFVWRFGVATNPTLALNTWRIQSLSVALLS